MSTTTKRRTKKVTPSVQPQTPAPSPPRQEAWFETIEKKLGCTAAEVQAAVEEDELRDILDDAFDRLNTLADGIALREALANGKGQRARSAEFAASLLNDLLDGMDVHVVLNVYDPTLTVEKLGLADFRPIRTVKQLEKTLTSAAAILEEHGHTDIANEWRKHLAWMPDEMDKEAINAVLLSACLQLANQGIIEGEL